MDLKETEQVVAAVEVVVALFHLSKCHSPIRGNIQLEFSNSIGIP